MSDGGRGGGAFFGGVAFDPGAVGRLYKNPGRSRGAAFGGGAKLSRDGGGGIDGGPRGVAGVSHDDDMLSKYPKTAKRHENTD